LCRFHKHIIAGPGEAAASHFSAILALLVAKSTKNPSAITKHTTCAVAGARIEKRLIVRSGVEMSFDANAPVIAISDHAPNPIDTTIAISPYTTGAARAVGLLSTSRYTVTTIVRTAVDNVRSCLVTSAERSKAFFLRSEKAASRARCRAAKSDRSLFSESCRVSFPIIYAARHGSPHKYLGCRGRASRVPSSLMGQRR
jgi:hypothetical protein